jgi:hypothetical protein
MSVRFLLYGNCQIQPLHVMLRLMFPEAEVHALPLSYCLIDGTSVLGEADISFIRSIEPDDYIIHQPLGSRYQAYSIDSITEAFVVSRARRISIPYIIFNPYFPDAYNPNPRSKPNAQYPFGEFPYGHRWIDESMASANSSKHIFDSIIDLINRRSDSLNYNQSVIDAISRLVHRERQCDVLISDFVLDMYQRSRLFHTYDHPVFDLYCVLMQRILVAMNCSSVPFPKQHQDVLTKTINPSMELPIYPGIAEALGLKFDTSSFSWGADQKIGLSHYIANYVSTCYLDTCDGLNTIIRESRETIKLQSIRNYMEKTFLQ